MKWGYLETKICPPDLHLLFQNSPHDISEVPKTHVTAQKPTDMFTIHY